MNNSRSIRAIVVNIFKVAVNWVVLVWSVDSTGGRRERISFAPVLVSVQDNGALAVGKAVSAGWATGLRSTRSRIISTDVAFTYSFLGVEALWMIFCRNVRDGDFLQRWRPSCSPSSDDVTERDDDEASYDWRSNGRQPRNDEIQRRGIHNAEVSSNSLSINVRSTA